MGRRRRSAPESHPCQCGRFPAALMHFEAPGLAFHCRGCLKLEALCSCATRPALEPAREPGDASRVVWSGEGGRYLTTTIVLALAVVLASCGSAAPAFDPLELDNPERIIAAAHAADPTPERPRVGCIMPTLGQQARVAPLVVDGVTYEGKALPEIVRVIGYTSPEDGHRAKVLRAGEFDAARWQPWPERAIVYGVRCGPEADAYGAAARQPPAEAPRP